MSGNSAAPEPDRPAGRFQDHVALVLVALFLVWTVKIVELVAGLSFTEWGLTPRTPRGLVGLVTMPFIHGDFDHIFSNTFGLLVLGLCLLHYYEKAALGLLLTVTLGGGLLVWLFARPSHHVGASGVIYGISSFLFLSGLMRRDRRSMGAALITALLFGGSIWGLLPLERGISWEGHLFGAVSGAAFAVFYNLRNPPPKPEWDEEPEAPAAVSGDGEGWEEPDPYRLYGDLEEPWVDDDASVAEDGPPRVWRVRQSRRQAFREMDEDWRDWFG